jgi:UDP-N-acetylglucosamine transferase subunit ALG13
LIYVTVGNHFQPFDRLIREMDRIAQGLDDRVVMQIGAGVYRPEHGEWFDFAPFETAERHIQEARFVVSHAGIGSIISARAHRKPIILVPRRRTFGEHFNDHQAEMVRVLTEERRPGVYPVEDVNELEPMVRRLDRLEEPEPAGPADSGRDRLLDEIERFVFGPGGPL